MHLGKIMFHTYFPHEKTQKIQEVGVAASRSAVATCILHHGLIQKQWSRLTTELENPCGRMRKL